MGDVARVHVILRKKPASSTQAGVQMSPSEDDALRASALRLSFDAGVK